MKKNLVESGVVEEAAQLPERTPGIERRCTPRGGLVIDAGCNMEQAPGQRLTVGGILHPPEGERRYAAIQTMRVPEHLRSSGIGTYLLEQTLTELCIEGATHLRCNVHSRPALRCFEKVLGESAVECYEVVLENWRAVGPLLSREEAYDRIDDLPGAYPIKIVSNLTKWQASNGRPV